MSGQIFISYRREESQWSARSLHDRLCRDFDPKQIFMDIDAIALGEDFVKAIETTVGKCDVLIAVIGNNWLASKDDRGDRRLDNPEDFVRMEIGTALKREIRVIPVLVDGALMPQWTELPDELKSLVRRNALRITATSFDGDCQRLAAAIRLVLDNAAAEQRQREDKVRSEAEQRETEAKERLEAERRQKEERQRVGVEQRQSEAKEERAEKENPPRSNLTRVVALRLTSVFCSILALWLIVNGIVHFRDAPAGDAMWIIAGLFLTVGGYWSWKSAVPKK